MQYDEFEHLRTQHPAWALLRSQNAALVLSFLNSVFVEDNTGALSISELSSLLEDELFALNERLGADASGNPAFPRAATAYLDDWASPERGWLRKFYPAGSDEAFYDLSPSVEKALTWIRDLQAREFIGTESRLNIIFELLRQMVFGSDDDIERRLEDLRRRRNELDEEIARAERGEVIMLDSVGQRDRYQQFSRMARELLSDFREVEENFRNLDRALRQKIAGWSGSKGELLDDVLGSRNNISESDQGRSFQAFYDFLLSHQRQRELSDLLEQLREIDDLPEQDQRMTRIHYEWIDASERTQATVRMLSEQLRRFLDDQIWLENRRVFDILHSIEKHALDLRDQTVPITTELDTAAINIDLPFERPLFRPQRVMPIDSTNIESGEDDFDTSLLHDQLYVDREALARTVKRELQTHGQVSLGTFLEQFPLQQGLAELITYLSLHDPTFEAVFDDEVSDTAMWQQTDEVVRVAKLPRVTYVQNTTKEGS